MRIELGMWIGVRALAFACVVACGSDHHDSQTASDVSPTTTTGANPPTTSSATPAMTANTSAPDNASPSTNVTSANMSDAEIVGVTDAANQGEMDQAKLAMQKSKDSKVKGFAKDMISDHGDAMKKLDGIAQSAGITTATSPTSMKLTSDSTTALSNLQSATGKDFDKQYIDLQVKEHHDVLDTLDQKLIPQATNSDLKSALKSVRDKVAKHLEKAQDIQNKMAGGSKS